MAIGRLAEMETVLVDEEIGLKVKSNLPPGFTNPDIPAAEKGQRIMANWRGLIALLEYYSYNVSQSYRDPRGYSTSLR